VTKKQTYADIYVKLTPQLQNWFLQNSNQLKLAISLSLITKQGENLRKDNQDNPTSDTKCEASLVLK